MSSMLSKFKKKQKDKLAKQNEKDINYFIKFLKRFYSLTEEKKSKILRKVYNENKELYQFLGSVKDLDHVDQEKLYSQLRNKGVNNWL